MSAPLRGPSSGETTSLVRTTGFMGCQHVSKDEELLVSGAGLSCEGSGWARELILWLLLLLSLQRSGAIHAKYNRDSFLT